MLRSPTQDALYLQDHGAHTAQRTVFPSWVENPISVREDAPLTLTCLSNSHFFGGPSALLWSPILMEMIAGLGVSISLIHSFAGVLAQGLQWRLATLGSHQA